MTDDKPAKSPPKARSKPQAGNKKEKKRNPSAKAPHLPNRRNIYIAFILILSAVIAGWKFYLGPKLSEPFSPQAAFNVETVGKPKIGGPFTLTDHNGRTVSDGDFRGRYMLVYFGYTFCPDVCPTALTVMSDALDLVGDKADKVAPIFITVDPERDTPEYLKAYVEHFHPRLLGLTGSPEQVAAAAKGYKVYYSKVGDGYDDGDYSMDHSSYTYLIGPDGEYVAAFGHKTDAEDMAKKLEKFL